MWATHSVSDVSSEFLGIRFWGNPAGLLLQHRAICAMLSARATCGMAERASSCEEFYLLAK